MNTKETAILITNPNEIDNLNNHEWFKFKCVKCGTPVAIQKRCDNSRIERYKTLLCQPCYAKKVKFEKYGDSNYNNHQQALKTVANWTPEQKEADYRSRCAAWERRTQEERDAIFQKGRDTYKEKTGYDHPFKDPEVQTKVRGTFQERYGVNYSGESPDLLQKSYKTYEQRTSYNHPSKNPKVIAKKIENWNNKPPEEKDRIRKRTEETNLERFGGKAPMCSDEIKNQTKEMWIKKYGVDNPMSLPEVIQKKKDIYYSKTKEEKQAIKDKRVSTNIEQWGVDSYSKTDEFKKSVNETCLEKYGSLFYMGTKDFIDKSKETNLKKYGTLYPSQSDVIKEKVAETCMNKFSARSFLETDEAKLKSIETNLEKRGVKYYLQSQEHYDLMMTKYGTIHPNTFCYYHGLGFDSTWELAVWIYCIDHNIPITRYPTRFEYQDTLGKIHRYEPDFMINGKLIEIKGDQFFREDGTMYFPFSKIHHDSDPMTLEEKAYYDDLFERKHQCGLQHGVEFWRKEDCEMYITYCNNRYPGWTDLYRRDNPWNPSYNCLYYINPGYYQPPYYVLIQDKGATPFDKPDKDGYILKGKGVSLWDIH